MTYSVECGGWCNWMMMYWTVWEDDSIIHICCHYNLKARSAISTCVGIYRKDRGKLNWDRLISVACLEGTGLCSILLCEWCPGEIYNNWILLNPGMDVCRVAAKTMQDDLSQCPLVYFTVEDAVVVYFWDCRVFEKYFQRTRKLQKSCGGWTVYVWNREL